ncbi:MAG: DUF3619 family protein [Burkholderiales bacterium]|nr:DUF3619 family protein [Burkholderiales bacterium]
MNENLIGRKIKRELDRGLGLPADTLARLSEARTRALASQQAREPLSALAGAGRIGLRLRGPTQWLTQVILPAALLVAAAFGAQQWQERQSRAQATAEIVDLDADLLKSDLPIDAYLDRDFQAWLKRASD